MKSRTIFIFFIIFFIVTAAGVVMAFNIPNDPKFDPSWSESGPGGE